MYHDSISSSLGIL